MLTMGWKHLCVSLVYKMTLVSQTTVFGFLFERYFRFRKDKSHKQTDMWIAVRSDEEVMLWHNYSSDVLLELLWLNQWLHENVVKKVFKGILQDLALSFVLVELGIFELPWFPPSHPPETRDLCIFCLEKILRWCKNHHFASSEDFLARS